MTGERVFCSRLKRKVPTNLNPPRHRRERYCPGFVPRQRKEHIACRFSLISRKMVALAWEVLDVLRDGALKGRW